MYHLLSIDWNKRERVSEGYELELSKGIQYFFVIIGENRGQTPSNQTTRKIRQIHILSIPNFCHFN